MKRVHVVAAVIERDDEILLARRPDHLHQGGKWEFPGGKLESGESPVVGLAREIYEELDIHVTSAEPLIRISHDYSDKHVLLDVWRVTGFSGVPVGKEGQQIRWVARGELGAYEFPAANVPIVTAVQLPRVYVISPGIVQVTRFVAELRATLEKGFGLVQIRFDIRLGDEEWAQLLAALNQFKQQYTVQFLLNSRSAKLQETDSALPEVFDGLHLTAMELLALKQRPQNCAWMAASCHSPEEISQAELLGVDFVTLSPVRATLSHPEAEPLGTTLFARWVDSAKVPVYGLGGMGFQDIAAMTSVAAQGVAGIRGFWQTLE